MNRTATLAAIIGLIVIVLLCGGTSWFLVRYNLAADIRDFLIILLAIESIIIGGLLMMMLWQLFQLIKVLRDEIIPLLTTTRETVDQVKHTTTFVGQTAAAPFISLLGFVAGVREMVDTLRGKQEPHEILQRDRHNG
jgi:hypothetical protein